MGYSGLVPNLQRCAWLRFSTSSSHSRIDGWMDSIAGLLDGRLPLHQTQQCRCSCRCLVETLPSLLRGILGGRHSLCIWRFERQPSQRIAKVGLFPAFQFPAPRQTRQLQQ